MKHLYKDQIRILNNRDYYIDRLKHRLKHQYNAFKKKFQYINYMQLLIHKKEIKFYE